MTQKLPIRLKTTANNQSQFPILQHAPMVILERIVPQLANLQTMGLCVIKGVNV